MGIGRQRSLAPRKLFDCFLFYNELDVLEIRLSELEPLVDYFVIVESRVTFQGAPKPLHFQLNQERYARWAAKIIHVVVDDLRPAPQPEASPGGSASIIRETA
jgi:hypothetical protein